MSIMELLTPLGWLQSAVLDRRRARVTVHRACYLANGQWAYFINVTNLSRNRDIEITHAWLDSVPQAHSLRPDRPLPKRLTPDEVWETWVYESEVPNDWRGERAFTAGRVRLSTGRILKSVKNKNVPGFGSIPGGN